MAACVWPLVEWSTTTTFVAIALTPVAIVILYALYNVFFHPLSIYPGPWLSAASDIPYILWALRGRPHERVLKLHQKYGDIVRIAPNDLSFINPEAWEEVMNVRAGGVENNKDPLYVDPTTGSIISVARRDHARIRKILGDGFSPRAVSRYQAVLQKHASSLVHTLQDRGENGKTAVDMVTWGLFVLIDIVYELTFGNPFGCLDTEHLPPCVDFAFSRAKMGAYIQALLRLPGAALLLRLAIPQSVIRAAQAYQQHLKDQIQSRITTHDRITREDFVGAMLSGKQHHTMDLREVHTNTEVLIMGGSETTASALCASLFCLASHPDAMRKVEAEIASNFQTVEDIDMAKVHQMKFLRAVINEAMRLHPPAPVALPRKTPKTGNLLFGKEIPGNITLGIWQWAAYHSERNFKQPFEFMPERWLGPEYSDDPRPKIFHPFSFGPRNCIGQSLATFQLHLLLVYLIWNFEISLAEESKDWLEQDVFILWQKKPLKLHMTSRSRPVTLIEKERSV